MMKALRKLLSFGWSLTLPALVLTLISCADSTCGDEVVCKGPDKTEYYRFDPAGDLTGAPVLMWMHAAGGSAKKLVDTQTELQELAKDQGFVLVFPESVDTVWNLHRRSDMRDDVAFLQDLRRSLQGQGLGPVLAGGFSTGSGISWAVACLDPDGFSGFYTASQTIFAPEPAACSGVPISVMTTHGLNDTQVPLGERFDSMMDKVRAESACVGTSVPIDSRGLACDEWACADDNVVRVCLHEGAHRDAPGWQERVLDFATERAGQ